MDLKLKIRREIAKRLKAARLLANLLQREVAYKAGVDTHTVIRIENGDCASSAENILLICRATNVDPAKIFGKLFTSKEMKCPE